MVETLVLGLVLPAYSCVLLSCLDSGDLCDWPRSCPPLHARLVVGAIVAQHEEDLPVYCMQWVQCVRSQARPLMVVGKLVGDLSRRRYLPRHIATAEMPAPVRGTHGGAQVPLADKHGSVGKTLTCTTVFWDVASTFEYRRGFQSCRERGIGVS